MKRKSCPLVIFLQSIFSTFPEDAANVFISVDLFTSRKPYKYDVFTQKYAYEFYNKEDKAFTCRENTDGKFKKNNLYCQPTINHIKGFILREYESTKN